MLKLALTGSIATGKSFVLELMHEYGLPVYNADHEVDRLYKTDAEVIAAMQACSAESVCNGIVVKKKLARAIACDPQLLRKVEKIIHPIIRQRKNEFCQTHQNKPCAVFEIPLLFETDQQNDFDLIIVTTATPALQLERALKRPGMNLQKFQILVKRQWCQSKKLSRAHYIIDSSNGKNITCLQVRHLIDNIHMKIRSRRS